MMSNYKPQFNQKEVIYFQNIFSHLKNIGTQPYELMFYEKVLEVLMSESSLFSMMQTLSRNKSFSHGDYTIQNILNYSDSSLCLIDPIYSENKFSSWYLDLAKFKWSIILERNPTWLDLVDKEITGAGPDFNKFVICEGIRTLKYCTPSEKLFRMELIEELCEQD